MYSGRGFAGDLTRHFPALTNTPVLTKLGFDPRTMPMKPMSVEQCVTEGLNALRENRSRIVPGRLNRFMDAFVPAFVKRTFTAKMLGKALASKSASASSRGGGPDNGRVMNPAARARSGNFRASGPQVVESSLKAKGCCSVTCLTAGFEL